MTEGSDPIRVVVVDDHDMFVELLERVFEGYPDIVVVGRGRTSAEGVGIVRQTVPDVVVVDHRLPDDDGIVTAARIRAEWPAARILMLTGSADDRVAVAAMDAGCCGFLTKDRAVQELVNAIRAAHAGQAYMSPRLLSSLVATLGGRPRGLGSDLTGREREILELLASGTSTRLIADTLALSVHTVRNHVQSILGKLDAHSKLEAVAIALREELIRLPSPRPSHD